MNLTKVHFSLKTYISSSLHVVLCKPISGRDKNYLDKNKKQKNNKLLIFGGIFILVLIITQFSNSSSSSSSSSINACECSERWLATPKRMMKSTDKWKYDECVRRYGGFAGAHNACNK